MMHGQTQINLNILLYKLYDMEEASQLVGADFTVWKSFLN
jgi:hypothetical protein